MKKVVLKVNYCDNKCKQKVMVKASGLSGVESVSVDKDQKLTLTGDIDPVKAAKKLGKLCRTDILSVGPAKEPEKKKEEPKKEEPKKQEPKKEAPKKPDETKIDFLQGPLSYPYTLICHPQYYHPPPQYYHSPPHYCTCPICVEENPSFCVIC